MTVFAFFEVRAFDFFFSMAMNQQLLISLVKIYAIILLVNHDIFIPSRSNEM